MMLSKLKLRELKMQREKLLKMLLTDSTRPIHSLDLLLTRMDHNHLLTAELMFMEPTFIKDLSKRDLQHLKMVMIQLRKLNKREQWKIERKSLIHTLVLFTTQMVPILSQTDSK